MSPSLITRIGMSVCRQSSLSLKMVPRKSMIIRCLASEPVPMPDNETKVYPQKIVDIVDQIGQLNLMEVSDLNELLKVFDYLMPRHSVEITSEYCYSNIRCLKIALQKRFNISDAPVMMAGSFSGAGPAAPAAKDEEEESDAPAAVQTSFTLKLEAFAADKKVALIKEIKSNVEGMNLVQAKKFVESAPAVVKTDLSKDEAEKLKSALEAVGGTCQIE